MVVRGTVHMPYHDVTYKSADWLLDSFGLDSARTINRQKRVRDFGKNEKMRGVVYQITVLESVRRRCESSLLPHTVDIARGDLVESCILLTGGLNYIP